MEEKKVSDVPLGVRWNGDKAGLQETWMDKEYIRRTVVEASVGSRFYANAEKRDAVAWERRVAPLVRRAEEVRGSADEDRARRYLDEQWIPNVEARERDASRVVVHVDMDCFFCAVEVRDNPQLRGLPIAVGDNAMLCTASYEARKYGVRSAQPGFIARKLCRELIVVQPRFEKYKAASDEVRKILPAFDPHFEMVGLDEAFLDVTDYVDSNQKSKQDTCSEIRTAIFAQTSLTASVGMGPNRLIAKIATGFHKPNGQTIIPQDLRSILDFVHGLEVRKIPGIGRRTEDLLQALEIRSCGDFYRNRGLLYLLLKPASFSFLMRSAGLGISSSTIAGSSDGHVDRSRKGISRQRTFGPLSDRMGIFQQCRRVCTMLAEDMRRESLRGRHITLMLKLSDFSIRSRSKVVSQALFSANDVMNEAWTLLQKELPLELRLIGVRVSDFQSISHSTLDRFLPKFGNSKSDEPIENQQSKDEAVLTSASVADWSYDKSVEDQKFKDEVKLATVIPVYMAGGSIDKSVGAQQSKDYVELNPVIPVSLTVGSVEDECSRLENSPSCSCPVCDRQFRGPDEIDRHIDDCLTVQSLKKQFSRRKTPATLSSFFPIRSSKPDR